MPSTITSRIDGLTTSVAVKAPIKIMTSSPITLFGEQTINAVTPDGSPVSSVVLDGDRVGVNGQTDKKENGIYVVRSTSWTRSKDFDGALDAVFGTLVTDTIPIIWRLITPQPVLFGTSDIVFETESGFNQGTTGYILNYLKFDSSRTVDSIALLRTLSSVVNLRAKVLGYYAKGDGGGGDYYIDTADATSADNGGTIIVAADGARWKLATTDSVSIKQFGAKGDGVTYDHVAVQAAISTGLTVHIPRSAGMYRLGTAITCVTPGQLIYGDGKNVSFFLVDTTFTMASLGVFIGLTGEPGPQFKYFGVSFIQPETSVRANLTTYPAAFYIRGNPRCLIDGVKIMNASRGIDAQGNCGGSSFLNIDCSAYNYTMILDGSFDSVRIHGMHNWPFGMLAANQTIFKEAASVGILSGRCDDLRISDSLFFCGTQLSTISTGSGFTGGVCTGVCFDTNPRVSIGAGIMQFANCTFSTGISSANAISVTGAGTRVQMIGCSYLCAVALAGPLVSIVGSPNTSISIVGGRFDTGNFDIPSFAISSANAVLSGCTFDRAAGTAYAQPTIAANAGSRITAQGNRATDKGAGAGVFMSVTADDYHNITGNSSPGWTYSKPAFTTGVFANNN